MLARVGLLCYFGHWKATGSIREEVFSRVICVVFPHSLKMLLWLNLDSLFFFRDPRSSQVQKDSVDRPLVMSTSAWPVTSQNRGVLVKVGSPALHTVWVESTSIVRHSIIERGKGETSTNY